jgi:hypothetical protein
MKPRKRSLFSLAILALLIIGIFGFSNPAGLIIEADQVKFTPKYLDMANTPYLNVAVKLTDADNITLVEEIDPTSVTLEGMIAPIATTVEYSKKGKPIAFHAEFAGSAVNGMLWYILGHTGISMPVPEAPIQLRLEISGKLIDGLTLWKGSAIAHVVNWAQFFPPD